MKARIGKLQFPAQGISFSKASGNTVPLAETAIRIIYSFGQSGFPRSQLLRTPIIHQIEVTIHTRVSSGVIEYHTVRNKNTVGDEDTPTESIDMFRLWIIDYKVFRHSN
jgi:hypothetical protein